MTNRNIVTYGCRGSLVSAMDHSTILYIRIITNPYKIDISPYYRIKPNGAFIAHFNIANYGCVFGNKAVLSPGWAYIFYR
jgi:hypothetical protein